MICDLNFRRLVVAVIFLLAYFSMRLGKHRVMLISPTIVSSAAQFDEEPCIKAITSAIGTTRVKKRENDTNLAVKLAMGSRYIPGDYVDVAINCPSVEETFAFSLIAAVAQRTVLREPYCNGGSKQKHAVVLAFSDENCALDEVKRLFEDHKFNIVDAHGSLDDTVDVPIHFMLGEIRHTLPDLPLKSIASLRISGGGDDDDVGLRTATLHALFSLYRRVHIGGYIALDGVWGDGVQDFFMDSKHTLLSTSRDSRSFIKKDVHIRIPIGFRNSDIAPSIDMKVKQAWDILGRWHSETVRNYVGNVGSNPYQSYRYIEAMRNMIQLQKKRSGFEDEEATVNVCETGYNGGHSAMMFLSFLDKEQGINVKYWGWDLKQVGSAAPIAEKMADRYGNNFHITWGDSKKTLKQAKDIMGGDRCHVIVVDGEHKKVGVVSDLNNFLNIAAEGAIVFGDDCAPYKPTVPKSEEMLEGWTEFVNRKQLIAVANYRNPDLPSPGFVEGIVPLYDGSYTLGI